MPSFWTGVENYFGHSSTVPGFPLGLRFQVIQISILNELFSLFIVCESLSRLLGNYFGYSPVPESCLGLRLWVILELDVLSINNFDFSAYCLWVTLTYFPYCMWITFTFILILCKSLSLSLGNYFGHSLVPESCLGLRLWVILNVFLNEPLLLFSFFVNYSILQFIQKIHETGVWIFFGHSIVPGFPTGSG